MLILSRINDYLRQQGRASLSDMAQGFDVAPEALRGMLAILERKGRVRRLPAGTACGGCNKCSPAEVQLYAWNG